MKKLFFTLFVFSIVIFNKDIALAEELPSDIIRNLGFTDDNMYNVDEYEYHFIIASHINPNEVIHFYSNNPFTVSTHPITRSDVVIDTTPNKSVYYDLELLEYELESGYKSIMSYDEKEDILDHDFSSRIFYVSHPVTVSNDSLEDIGYPEGSVFFSPAQTILPQIVVRMKNQNQFQPLSQVISLIPIVVGLAVSFLALRKALQMLRELLQRA